ncbi:Prenyltransferase and squalene oxidase repeat protein [Pirellulimonas nuda]|uniref:Prenyltransferase and squalene oxidase repeat protein n=1 Tax=Pirellulimonas nuda TaxID=2528009 RepID=A0A518DJV8_9BACT|nr:prenyltransferase/squalene oxidase repeat-containing protein [Pirellulimonas nuda]QDU91760.1 Prenyltransferase and squalene oxidase repeat protein [Pirellulimonas nuda]
MQRRAHSSLLALSILATAAAAAHAADPVGRAVSYLRSAQAEDGSFSPQLGPAVTGLVVTGLVKNGRSLEDPMVAKGLGYLLKHAKPDGGIYSDNSKYQNYETCIAIMTLAAANKDGRYDDQIAKAEAFVKDLQWDEDEAHDPSSMAYGGAGYGSHRRPDLSNTAFLMEALQAGGTPADDPAMQKALEFVSRCQNLETEHNTTKYASMVNDGGFYYTCAAGGSSQAGELEGGGLRSYGSMTYAGLKSMIYAGVGPDDPRVKAAQEWIAKNYALDENPGMGTSGLYYYYHTFAKALATLGDAQLTGADGVTHDWRKELTEALAKQQNEDGSWTNANERWLESDPNLSTAYALVALSYCK